MPIIVVCTVSHLPELFQNCVTVCYGQYALQLRIEENGHYLFGWTEYYFYFLIFHLFCNYFPLMLYHLFLVRNDYGFLDIYKHLQQNKLEFLSYNLVHILIGVTSAIIISSDSVVLVVFNFCLDDDA